MKNSSVHSTFREYLYMAAIFALLDFSVVELHVSAILFFIAVAMILFFRSGAYNLFDKIVIPTSIAIVLCCPVVKMFLSEQVMKYVTIAVLGCGCIMLVVALFAHSDKDPNKKWYERKLQKDYSTDYFAVLLFALSILKSL